MWDFCKYKHIFGKPNTGLHSYRLFNIAIVDVICTIALAYFIQYYFMPKSHITEIMIYCFLLGIIMHRVFCVRTTIDKLLF